MFYNERHQAILEEPRDYVMATDPVRDLRRSTYKYLGGDTDRTVCLNISLHY